MYSPLNVKSGALQTGAAQVAEVVAKFPLRPTPDGLAVEVDTSAATPWASAAMPDRLYRWLLDLRLLRNIPLCYLVADSALLPPESIRFFNVDATWVDRVIDGVFSAANTGTVDITYSVAMLQMVRETLDAGLVEQARASVPGSTWLPAQGITGMLIRSDLVRRWPDVMVRAYAGPNESSTPSPILRAEAISKDIYIALFAGTPQLVQLREPHVAVRFGLETENQVDFTYKVRNSDGSPTNVHPPNVKLSPARVIPVQTISLQATVAAKADPVLTPIDAPRLVAIQLMRQPYVQQFIANAADIPESCGSVFPASEDLLETGRFFNVKI